MLAAAATLALAGPLTLLGSPTPTAAQTFTRADTLRGSITPERAWWDVRHYDLDVRVSPSDSTVRGSVGIGYEVVAPVRRMQIDLQVPLEVDSIVQEGEKRSFERDGNAFFVDLPSGMEVESRHEITVHYHGRPKVATNPPWDGGFIWATDPDGDPWVATANQGLGASVWWPNKDHQSDEPDSMRIRVTVPSSMTDVSNGRLREVQDHPDGTTSYTWVVRNPINNYNVAVNAGDYVHFSDTLQGLAGTLDLDYWVLEPHLDEARRQFVQVKPMLRCFEGWFGPFPFYEDGYKLVEAPHLGMEHQSAVAYGNGFRNGYRGQDLSGTGWGLTWDFIIVHESAHEWFGNNITTSDIADMWVHEAFANYSESLYTECLYGKQAGSDYVIGTRSRILNDAPIIGAYGVQREGSGDMYYKGGNLLHTLRQLVDDDALWRSILTGLNREFRHATVSSAQVEAYVSGRAGLDLSRVFDQYLRHADIPTLEYRLRGGTLEYRWRADVEGFAMPVRVTVSEGRWGWIVPTAEAWGMLTLDLDDPEDFRVDPGFYVRTERVPDPG
jgi:aminopeptidase N